MERLGYGVIPGAVVGSRPRTVGQALGLEIMAMGNLQVVGDLGMRVRELTLLHDVAGILQRDDLTPAADWLDEITQAIQRSWPRPSIVDVRARLGTFEVTSSSPANVPCIHRAEFV